MRRANWMVFGVLVGFILGLLLIYGISRFQATQRISQLLGEADPALKLGQGVAAPDFELSVVSGASSGEQIQLKDLRGKVVLINFWATWCGPCEVEMPVLQSFYEKYPDDFIVLAVNSQDEPETIRTYLDEHNLTFPALLDENDQVFRQYFVPGFPTSYLLDRDGIIQKQHVGLLTAGHLEKYLGELGFND